MNKKSYIQPRIKAKDLESAPLLDRVSGPTNPVQTDTTGSDDEGGSRGFEDVDVWNTEE